MKLNQLLRLAHLSQSAKDGTLDENFAALFRKKIVLPPYISLYFAKRFFNLFRRREPHRFEPPV